MQLALRPLFVAAVCALATACSYDPAFEVSCDAEGASDGNRVCRGGVWIVEGGAADLGPDSTSQADMNIAQPDVAVPDMTDPPDMGDPDAACVPEENVDFCARLGLDCDEVTAADNCGVERTIACGTCAAPETCGANGTANVCACVAESDIEYCARLVKTCGDVADTDNCGTARTVNCGTCTAPATCGGGGTPNVCACDTQTDTEFCAANGAVCGALTAVDECGQMRTTNCGTCTGPETCGAVTANQCDCPADALVCTALSLECGTANVSASCGNKTMVDCGGCQANAACAANMCGCLPGYVDDGLGNCADTNECMTGTDNCAATATCTNTAGSFMCACNAGYTGNGVTCTDTNECMAGTDNCNANATCTNTPGSFSCACNTGYTGTGVMCADVNECTAGTDNCDVNATCTNTPGSFSCACNSGYTGNGVMCTSDASVVSVQTVTAVMNGTLTASVNLPTAVIAANAIPFISLWADDADADDSTVDVVIANDRVDVSRAKATATVTVVVTVVEFDPAHVSVQANVPFSAAGDQTITSVTTNRSFMTFAAAVNHGQDELDNRMLAGKFASSTAVNIARSGGAGSIAGHFWVAEALNGEFGVQHVSGTIAMGSTSASLPVTAVDPDAAFVVYSYQTTENAKSSANGQVSCAITSATSVECTRVGNTQTITNLNVQVVSLPGSQVRRGTATQTGTATSSTSSITAVTAARSHANLGQTGSNGACKTDETSNNGAPTAFATVELTAANEVTLERSSGADGEIECTWEVIQWP